MADQVNSVIVIVDPGYSASLETTAQSAPVWIVASDWNRAACKRAWAHIAADHREKGAVTSFNVTDPEDRSTNLLEILPDLEEHHGRIRGDEFNFPKGFVLRVIGLTLDNDLIPALKSFGFSSFAATEAGFDACVSTKEE